MVQTGRVTIYIQLHSFVTIQTPQVSMQCSLFCYKRAGCACSATNVQGVLVLLQTCRPCLFCYKRAGRACSVCISLGTCPHRVYRHSLLPEYMSHSIPQRAVCATPLPCFLCSTQNLQQFATVKSHGEKVACTLIKPGVNLLANIPIQGVTYTRIFAFDPHPDFGRTP